MTSLGLLREADKHGRPAVPLGARWYKFVEGAISVVFVDVPWLPIFVAAVVRDGEIKLKLRGADCAVRGTATILFPIPMVGNG